MCRVHCLVPNGKTIVIVVAATARTLQTLMVSYICARTKNVLIHVNIRRACGFRHYAVLDISVCTLRKVVEGALRFSCYVLHSGARPLSTFPFHCYCFPESCIAGGTICDRPCENYRECARDRNRRDTVDSKYTMAFETMTPP
jgi:hypothetical protein